MAQDIDDSWLAIGDDIEPEAFPELTTISARMLYRFLPVPDGDPVPPEYVYVRYPTGPG
jgi:hypothetical protein